MNLQLTWLNETNACTILDGNLFGKHVCLSSREIIIRIYIVCHYFVRFKTCGYLLSSVVDMRRVKD
jgi:hypothetical protein